MFELAYTSRASEMMTEKQLQILHDEAILFNQKQNITGLLLYNDGIFFQVLEGEESSIQSLYASIKNDFRHYDVRTIYQQPLAQRNFSNWAMSFHNLSADSNNKPNQQHNIELNNTKRWDTPFTAQLLVNAFKKL